MTNITTKEEFAKFVADNKLVLMDFWAEWCGPCKMLAPILDALAKSTAGKVAIAKVNVDAAGELARDHRVRSIPTLLVLKDGEVVTRIVGVRSENDLTAELQKFY